MQRIARPWSRSAVANDRPFAPADCLLSFGSGPGNRGHPQVTLIGDAAGSGERVLLHPYPKRSSASGPAREGFPVRPRPGQEPADDAELFAQATLARMNEVLARIQELEEALDDPANLWARLRRAWHRAEDEQNPMMAEIVRQAREMSPVLRELQTRLRRVLRRERELTPLDRVQEMDRSSMRWLGRQPGRSIAERAGMQQRILSTVRRENFDTLENRVLHAYTRIARDVAREWLQAHPRAGMSERYRSVDAFRRSCNTLSRALADLGIAVAGPGITPNYVLMQDKGYLKVFRAWERLVRRDRVLDDLWAWQAQSWTDFVVLAIILAIDELEESELIAQSPILWHAEAVTGRWFDQDRPIAVFWLRRTERIVEIQARPDAPGQLQLKSRAHVSLRITVPDRSAIARRIPVWTPHSMTEIDVSEAAEQALPVMEELQALNSPYEIMRDAIIVTPAHGAHRSAVRRGRRCSVHALSLGPSGAALGEGLEALRRIVRSDIWLDEA